MRTLLIVILGLQFAAFAAENTPVDPAREREMRERYEKVLLRNPFQERAFNSVYESYAKVEGVDKWVEALKPQSESGDDAQAALLLLGQIYDRQFKTAEAIAALEKAAAKGEERPQFKVLLGTLYYKVGKDDKAAGLLSAGLDTLTDLDQRSAVCRMLGNLYLRQSKRDEAIKVWQRIAEQNPDEMFAQIELAEILSDNRMWDQAINVYRQIVERSKDDPYRRCRALRSIGQGQVQGEKFKEALATYEQALELVSPGNWLFEDLKLRLVGVYEDIGDLAGLVKYVQARLDQNPGDLEFRDLLAETYARMTKFTDAEKEYRTILERNPRSSSVYEKLIGLYMRTGQKAELAAAFEKLIELFPTDTDYLRRLGEFHVRDGDPAKAKETWRRIVANNPNGERFATLAGWLESYEFPEDAIAAYQQALEKSKNRDWTERLASLKHQKGDEAEAVKLWLSMIDPANSKAEEYAAVASILEANGKIDDALKLRKAAIDKEPKNLESRLAYARALMKKQQFEAAIPEFDLLAAQTENEYLMQQGESGRLDAWRELGVIEDKQKELERELNANPTDAYKLGQLARLYERAGQREKAIALYETRREKEPGNIEHLRSLANLYKGAKQTDLAIATFKALLEHDKNRARVYQKELLDIYLGLDLKAESIAAAEAIVSLAPGDPEARLTLAQVYHLYRQPEKAFTEYRYALRLEPNEPDYHRQYGDALSQEKNFGEAQEAFRKMLDTAKEDGTRVAAVSQLARIHLQQGRLDELASEFQRRIRNTPKKLAAYEELAAIHKESGQIVKAVETLESGLQNVDEKTSALRSLIRTTFEAQDFSKTRSYFEQLLAQSGKPSAQEYERLGQIYAQLGELEKAKATWARIVSDAPKDAKAHDRLSSVLRENGFTDEALVMKAKAVELDAADYKRRFEYAQLLAQNEQPVEALKQLKDLLEIGDREEAKKETETEKKVERVAKGQQGRAVVSPYQFVYGMRSSGGGYYGGGWQGSYKQFRPQLLMFMANVAQRSIGEDSFIEQLNARVQKAKANIDAKRDLLSILQMYNRVDEALKLALEILAQAPNDTDLLQQTALYYQTQQQIDKAIPLMEQMAQTHPKQRVQALTALAPLYFQGKQEAKALEAADQLLKENPNDMTVIYAMGNFMQNNGKLDRARAIYEKGLEIDPQSRPNVLYNLAQIAQRENKHDEAVKLYTEMLTTDPGSRYAYMGPRRQQNLYVPVTGSSRSYSSNPMGNIPSQVFGYIDYQKGQAITQLKRTKSGTTNTFAQLEEIARSYGAAVSASERNRAWDTTKLLCAYYITEKDHDKAGQLLKWVHEAGFDEMEWYNGAIYLAQITEDYAAMLKLYDQVLDRFPAKARDVVQAKTVALVMAKNYEDASKLIRDMNQQRVPPGQVLNLINNLVSAGEKKLAKDLLEGHLSGVSRNSDALAALGRLYADDNDYEKAITLGNEAWDRKSHGRQSHTYYSGSGYYYSSTTTGDSLLRDLHRFYVGAGKSEELIGKFKERLEKQPGSVQAYEYLAQLYRLNSKRDEALAIYQQLTEKRPHLMQAKRQIASLYTEMGDMKKATAFYESLLKTTPTAYQEISWELRYLYQRMGKGKELAQMEDKLATKARDPHQVRQLADRYRQEGDVEKAIDLYRKAIQMSPADVYIKNQLAGVLVEAGRLDEAVKLYEEWLDTPQIRGQAWIDHNTMKQLVGLFRGTGKLQVLKDRCEEELKKNSNDRISKAMQVHIAVIEKRFDDAITGFKTLAQSGQDPNGIYEIMNLADITGNVQAALEIVEKGDQNYYDEQRLARLYYVKGDRKKTQEMLEKYWERTAQYGGNRGYYARDILRQYADFELWDAAEAFAKKNRDVGDDSYERQEIDRAIADAYARHGHYKGLVDDILKKESFKGRDLDLLKAIARELKGSEEGGKRRQFLEKLVVGDPKNRDLAAELADVYAANPKDADKRLNILKELVGQEPNSTSRRTAYTAAMIEADRADEALTELEKWVAEKPVESRYVLLSGQQKAAGRLRQARASLEKALQLADSSKKIDLQLQVAEFDEQYGDPGPRRTALKARFEKRRDANSFRSYLDYLDSAGLNAEAYALFMTNKDAGYLDRYQGDTVYKVCMNEGDYQTPLDLNWQFLRYAEYYNRQSYFDRTARVFAERGKFLMLVNDMEARVNGETNRNFAMMERLGKAWERAGYPEKALEIYNSLTATNPFNRNALQARTDLLLALKRTDQAMEFLRSGRGITTLDAEVTAKQQLAGVLFKIKREADAEAELNALLAWAQGGSVLEKAGDTYFAAKKYDRAAEIYEKAAKASRSYNYSTMLANLGKCYAHLGRMDEAIKIWESRPSARGGGSSSASMQEWLLAERLFDGVIKYIEPKLEGDVGEVRRYIGLAQAYIELGKTNEAFAVLHRASKEVPSDNQADLRRRTASLLINYDLVPAALAETTKTDDPKLAAALVEVFGGTSNRTEIASLAPLLKDFKTSDHELQIYTGDALLRQKQPEAAAAWFRQALPSSKHRIRVSAARGLALAGATEEAAPVLRECLERRPQEIFNNPALLSAAAKAGLRELMTKVITENALHDTHRDYLLTLVDYHSGNTNLALGPLLDRPNLSATALQELTKIAAPADRIKAFKRLATGGYSASARLAAQSEMARYYAQNGNWKESIGILAQMFQPFNEAEEARQGIAKVVTKDNYSQFHNAVIEVVRGDPAQDSASDLLGFCKQVAQRLGQDESAARLAQTARAADVETQEAAVWDALLEQWEIAGPYAYESRDTMYPPEHEALSVSNSLAAIAWKKTDSNQMLGVIRVARALGIERAELGNQVSYARMQLRSAEERRVVFCFGSSEWAKVWVNGEQVHSTNERRSCAPDQDRFVAILKSGANTVLIKVGGGSFCLRPEGATGLDLARN